MRIIYKNRRIEKMCTDASMAEKKYGINTAQTIQQRIDQILSVETIEEMCQNNLGGCHKLRGDRKGQYAMKLPNGQRLIFSVIKDLVQIAEIMDITDYH